VADHQAVQTGGGLQILPASPEKTDETSFMVLHEGRIQFEGTFTALRESQDAYLQEFLFMTLPPW
jgi:hypothetical protein